MFEAVPIGGAGPLGMVQQFIHGTLYIDELVMMHAKSKGDLYVHQDANYNVIALTDLGGNVVERPIYTPYGEITVQQDTSFGDRDGDGDVDSTDKGTPGSTCTGIVSGACRILDLDFDGDYDSTDATAFDSLPQGLAHHPGRFSTGVDQPFGHQGLLYEPELGSYQNRARQYIPSGRRFAQRDPLSQQSSASSGYQDGLNLYQAYRGAPIMRTDPTGLFFVCGSGPIRWIIPDGPSGYDFSTCCFEHDQCYGCCYNDGSHCYQKWECDVRFLGCMVNRVCKRYRFLADCECRIYAHIYFSVVDNLGDDAFNSACGG